MMPLTKGSTVPSASPSVPNSNERASLLALIEASIDEPPPSSARRFLESQKELLPDNSISIGLPRAAPMAITLLLPFIAPPAAVARITEALQRQRMRRRLQQGISTFDALAAEIKDLGERQNGNTPYRESAQPKLISASPLASFFHSEAVRALIVSYRRVSRHSWRVRWPIFGLCLFGAIEGPMTLRFATSGYDANTPLALSASILAKALSDRPGLEMRTEHWFWIENEPTSLKHRPY